MPPEIWRPVLTAPAEQDLIGIIRWTAEQVGARQASAYRDLIIQSLLRLREGPEAPGARARPELGAELSTLSIARHGKPGRHFLLYRPQSGQVIEILRVLHQSMDIERHVPPGAAKPDAPSNR
jgi:toxin ParE1/3/4